MVAVTIVYLAAFAVLGLWSAYSDRQSEPLAEVLAEATSVLVLSGGVVLYLVAAPFPGGNRLWLLPLAFAVAAEVAVVIRSRRRTLGQERVLGTPGIAWKAALTDFGALLFFAPAIVLNIRYAYR